jgi:hypothetical protein
MAADEPQREFVYLPWHFRDRLTPTRTYCGRVIYDRPKHLFGLSDAYRIINRITISPSEKEFNKITSILRLLWNFAIAYIPFWTTPFEHAFNFLIWAYDNAFRSMTDSMIAVQERAKQLILEVAADVNLKVKFEK